VVNEKEEKIPLIRQGEGRKDAEKKSGRCEAPVRAFRKGGGGWHEKLTNAGSNREKSPNARCKRNGNGRKNKLLTPFRRKEEDRREEKEQNEKMGERGPTTNISGATGHEGEKGPCVVKKFHGASARKTGGKSSDQTKGGGPEKATGKK